MSITVLSLLVGPSTSAPAGDRCSRAKALYDAGYYADAENQYKRLIGVADCASTDLLIQARDMVAKAARTAAKSPQDKLEQARRLQAAGFENDARKLVKSVVRESTKPVPHGLRAADQRTGWWREQLGTYGPPLRFAAEALAVALGTIAVLLLALNVVYGAFLRFFVPSARLRAFSGSNDATLDAVLTATLGAALARLDDEGTKSPIHWQSATEPKFEVPTAVSSAVPQAQLLAGLLQMLDRLFPRRAYVVSGTVHPVHEHLGAGLTLVVARRSRTVAQVTIWESEFLLYQAGSTEDDLVRYEHLILPGAIWLGYQPKLGFGKILQIRHPSSIKRFIRDHVLRALAWLQLVAKLNSEKAKRQKAPLQTLDWRSYALFAVGEAVHHADADAAASLRRTLY